MKANRLLKAIGLSTSCAITIFSAFAQEAPPPSYDTTAPTASASEAIISEREEIEAVNDSSVAEAVDRRPDLQFNNITIDGEKSNVSLSEIPAEAVSSIEVLRAITPDLDADARGGALSLESKPTFELDKPISKGDITFEYVEATGKWSKEGSYTFGKSLGALGYRITTAVEFDEDSHESFRYDWRRIEEDGHVHFVPRYALFRHDHSSSEEFSINSRFDYRVSENLRFFLRADISRDDHEEYEPRLRYRFDRGEYTDLSIASGTSNGARIERDLLGFEARDDDYLIQLGGVFTSGNWKIDFKASQEDSDYIEPDWYIVDFNQDEVDLAYSWTDPRFPTIASPSGEPLDDPGDFEFHELLSERWGNAQTDETAIINAKYDFESEEISGFFKTGLKYRSRTKNQLSDSRLFTEYLGDYALADVLREGYEQTSVSHPNLEYGPFPSLPGSREFFRSQPDNFPLNVHRTRIKSDPGTYEVTEDITSAYVMLNIEKGKNRGIIGARMERTELSYLANEVIVDENGVYSETIPSIDGNSYQDFFPSVHYRRFLGPKSTFIASWTGTIQRPYYGSIVPYRYINYDNQDIDAGNPNLSPTQYDNIDLSFDYKLSEDSTLSIEAYSRDVTDIVYWEVSEIQGGPFDGFEFGQNENGPSAKRKGINLILSQNLADWSKNLEGFSFNLKTSLADSETEYPNRLGVTLPVTNVPDTKHQLSLTYKNEKTYLQFLYKYRAGSLSSVDDNEWHDRYKKERTTLDFSSSYQLNSSTRLFLNIENLTEEPDESYLGSTTRPSHYDLEAREINFGAKLQF